MPIRIDARPDHIAVAVPEVDAALPRWRDGLGGRYHGEYDSGAGFRTTQYRFRGGAKLELLEPTGPNPAPFAQAFLDRFGPGIHHLTLLVPDLDGALTALVGTPLEPVDVRKHERWHEAFIRPSAVGGLVVQLAWSGWPSREHEPTPTTGARLLGARLRHPDLGLAERVWSALGADVAADDGALVASWGDAPLHLLVEEGDGPAGPVALRFAEADALPQDAVAGAAVEAVADHT